MQQRISMNVRIKVPFLIHQNLKIGAKKYRGDKRVIVLDLKEGFCNFV